MEVEYKLVCMFLTQLKLNTLSDQRNNGMIVSKNVSQTICSRFRFKDSVGCDSLLQDLRHNHKTRFTSGRTGITTTRRRSDLRLQS